ncbi:MAG: SpoIIE family protein phosphatase [Bryobacteraceae bacterium]|nr:SpoIIE family protein phosphatase [Bryobacteraceae bacterium]
MAASHDPPMTPARGSERTVESLQASVRSLTEQLLNCYEELTLLYSLGARLGRENHEDAIAAAATERAREVLGAECGFAALWERGRPKIPSGACVSMPMAAAQHVVETLLKPAFAGSRRRLIVHSFSEEMPGPEGLPARLLASCICDRGEELGYLCLGRGASAPIFTAADQKLLDAVATMAGAEIDNVRLQRSETEKQRLVRELEMARQIQQWLLPSDSRGGGFLEAAGLSQPCFEIGGDFYDFFPAGDHETLMVIADVTGKGAPASLQAAMIQGIVHGSSRQSTDIALLMGCLNECLIARSVRATYPTALVASLARDGSFRYGNAGHPPPIIIRRCGHTELLKEGGPLLGVISSANYSVGTTRLSSGDLVVLYTDGATDAENSAGEMFGEERLRAWAQRQTGLSPSDVRDNLLEELSGFCSGSPQADDLTALVVRYAQT